MDITLKARIVDNGILIDSIIYNLIGNNVMRELNSTDFEIVTGDLRQSLIGMQMSRDSLTLLPEPFFFDGIDRVEDGSIKHYDFQVKCKDTRFNFDKNTCKIEIETVDDFMKGTYTGSNGITLPYWLYLPEENDLPLMVWEHGGGEVLDTSYEGANITKNRGATCWIEDGPLTGVLSFQYPSNYPFGISEKADSLEVMKAYNLVKYEMIQELILQGKVDKSRIYISGASSGGGAVLRFLIDYPGFFAGALPICAKDTLVPISEPYGLAFKMTGSLDLDEAIVAELYQKVYHLLKDAHMKDTPIWFAHAAEDPVCTRYTSTLAYEALEELGGINNRITLYNKDEMEAGGASFLHASWIPVFNDKEVINWIYQQKLN